MGLGNPQSPESWEILPVESVSWLDVCGNEQRTGGFLGRVNDDFRDQWKFDLPTEAQWEYACRAGTTGPNSADLDLMAWYVKNRNCKTHPVGQRKANAWGLHDMHGNVWESCADWYGEYPNGTVTDPQGATSGTARVVRGGSWYNFERVFMRSGCRFIVDPLSRGGSIGFRVVLVGGGG